jgi:hypothetical protein
MTDFLLPLWPIARDVMAFVWWLLPTTVQEGVLWQFVYLPLLLAILYIPAIQYERGGWWKLLMPFTAFVALLDVYLNWTTFSILLRSTPGRREITFSQHLERLVFEQGLRGKVARAVARYTNKFDPTPPHIPLP